MQHRDWYSSARTFLLGVKHRSNRVVFVPTRHRVEGPRPVGVGMRITSVSSQSSHQTFADWIRTKSSYMYSRGIDSCVGVANDAKHLHVDKRWGPRQQEPDFFSNQVGVWFIVVLLVTLRVAYSLDIVWNRWIDGRMYSCYRNRMLLSWRWISILFVFGRIAHVNARLLRSLSKENRTKSVSGIQSSKENDGNSSIFLRTTRRWNGTELKSRLECEIQVLESTWYSTVLARMQNTVDRKM